MQVQTTTDAHDGVPTAFITAVWVALLVGAVVHVPIILPTVGLIIQPALFDIILPAIVLCGLLRGWFGLPSRGLQIISVAIVSAIMIHSALVYSFGGKVFVSGLLKETVKLVTLFIHFILLLILFSNADFRSPPRWTILIVLIVFIPIILLISHFEPIAVTRTVYAVSLSGLVCLIALDGRWRSSRTWKFVLVLACAAIVMVAIMLYNKGVAGVMLAIMVWIIMERWLSVQSTLRILLVGMIIAGVTITGIVLSAYAGANFEILRNMDSIERSVNIRLLLWSVAADRFWETFPVGIGLGQFSLAAKTVPLLALEGHKFVHNSFLGLMAELGILGVFCALGILFVVLNAARGWPSFAVPIFLLLVFPPLLIHDGQSIRILLLITALGFALYWDDIPNS